MPSEYPRRRSWRERGCEEEAYFPLLECEICHLPGMRVWVLQLVDGSLIVSTRRTDLAAALPLTFEVAPQECEILCPTHLDLLIEVGEAA